MTLRRLILEVGRRFHCTRSDVLALEWMEFQRILLESAKAKR